MFFGLLVPSFTMTDSVPSSAPAPLDLLLALNLNINLNAETSVHDDMYNVKYQRPDTLHELVLFAPIKQIRVHHPMFKVTSFVDFGPYLKSFDSLDDYIYQLRD